VQGAAGDKADEAASEDHKEEEELPDNSIRMKEVSKV
jgi:hypothetical protein